MVGIPRSYNKYRAYRRNNSNLGYNPSSGIETGRTREVKDWYGVKTKLRPEPPPLYLVQSSPDAKHPGEIHYKKAWK